ncbi:MAG: S8 family serine peptidase [Planctomycetota bacterium]|jgi:hypothetical protein
MKAQRLSLVTTIAVLAGTAVASAPLTFPKIDRRPAPGKWPWWRTLQAYVPRYDPNSDEPFQVDLRGRCLAGLDLRDSLADLQHASFADGTMWPPADKMPPEFDPGRIAELGKDPGLGVRRLHQQGTTGRGVGIAILDQPLLVDHTEYAQRLQFYEEINIRKNMKAQMHDPAVASIAVGKTVGVAPQADLYYIAQFNGDFDEGKFTWNFEYLARGLCRILEINEQLPRDKKIRVISISVGWSPSQKGYQQVSEAATKAKAAGMLVICSSVEATHGFKFQGLGRPPMADPDTANSFEPGYWWADRFYAGSQHDAPGDRLLVPMDSRTTASQAGPDNYVFYRHGGWSWAIPYIAGTYARAAQEQPQITPDQFWALALKTGHTIELCHEGTTHKFGPILNPAGLIDALRQPAAVQERKTHDSEAPGAAGCTQ